MKDPLWLRLLGAGVFLYLITRNYPTDWQALAATAGGVLITVPLIVLARYLDQRTRRQW